MNRTKRIIASAAAVMLTAGLILASPASAHPTPEPDCDGETYAVVSADGDAAMAELIASWGVLDTDCVVSPGQTALIGSQQTVVLGGTKAVPESAVRTLNVIVRLAGADRVETARAVLAWIDARNAAEQPEPDHTQTEWRCLPHADVKPLRYTDAECVGKGHTVRFVRLDAGTWSVSGTVSQRPGWGNLRIVDVRGHTCYKASTDHGEQTVPESSSARLGRTITVVDRGDGCLAGLLEIQLNVTGWSLGFDKQPPDPEPEQPPTPAADHHEAHLWSDWEPLSAADKAAGTVSYPQPSDGPAAGYPGTPLLSGIATTRAADIEKRTRIISGDAGQSTHTLYLPEGDFGGWLRYADRTLTEALCVTEGINTTCHQPEGQTLIAALTGPADNWQGAPCAQIPPPAPPYNTDPSRLSPFFNRARLPDYGYPTHASHIGGNSIFASESPWVGIGPRTDSNGQQRRGCYPGEITVTVLADHPWEAVFIQYRKRTT